jgi:flagellar biosynthesis GTPase FlhF
MTVKRFVGATARDCLRRAKEEFGPDAVVISNKAVEMASRSCRHVAGEP